MRTIILTLVVLYTSTVKSTGQGIDTVTVYSISTNKTQSNTIPESVFEMANLKRLTVIGMDCDGLRVNEQGDTTCWAIKQIPKNIDKLMNLEVLELRVNSIQSVPKEIMNLKNLKILDLTDNPGLINIDNVVWLENLEDLVLFGCDLHKLPPDIGRLKKLKYLGLTGNNIDSAELKRIRKALPTCDIKF